MKVGSQELIH